MTTPQHWERWIALLACAMSVSIFAADLATAEAGHTTLQITALANTAPDAKIYVAGSFNQWQPGAESYRLTPKGNGQYAITLPPSVHGAIEFKFTLGSWDESELDAAGAEPSNRKFDASHTSATTYTGTVPAWHAPATTIAALQHELEKILKDTHTPGMSVAIVRRDGPEWIAGLGVADVASGRAATADTLFRIGSTSKAFAGMAILKLVNEGKLSLQDPVRKLAPEVWFENPWEETNPVRVVDLLEHTTGWDDMHLREYAKDAPGIGLAEALDYDHHSRVSRWRPGTRMAYCNSGPAVAALIVEKISGQHFEDYVNQNFFTPIGMKSATYFQTTPEEAATLYHGDGKTAYPYWNILMRPAGAINASARDMAAYLSFYLHRGSVNGSAVLPSALVDRMETPTRTWGAQEGLKLGYGIYNYAVLQDGLVFHGHDGGMEGSLTQMGYLPDPGAGYFFSINTADGATFEKIAGVLRGYVTRGMVKPSLPAAASLPAPAADYEGWYEPDSPRVEMLHFQERLFGLTRVTFNDGKMQLTSVLNPSQPQTLIPTAGMQFRSEADPIATSTLITPNQEGVFIQRGWQTLGRIPTWFALAEIALSVWLALALAGTTLYAPVWLLANLRKRWRKPDELWLKVWPLTATLSLVVFAAIGASVGEAPITRLGNVTPWSVGLCLATLLFAFATAASAFALWLARGNKVRKLVYGYAISTTVALWVALIYLAYWGVIGIRTWA